MAAVFKSMLIIVEFENKQKNAKNISLFFAFLYENSAF